MNIENGFIILNFFFHFFKEFSESNQIHCSNIEFFAH
tara:strand:- start:133 stop:243 length:111 start_codon:yes stop_codon:yes gene_type:complete